MPLYEYRCPVCGTVIESRRPTDERDSPVTCSCGAAARRVYCLQAPIVRPLGYSLKPGDRGYWAFETPDGRRGPRESIAPFAKAEEMYAHPPLPPDDDRPVGL